MKWLILAFDVKNKNIETFENLIESNNEQVDEFVFTEDLSDYDLNQCMTSVCQSTHCIILDADKLQKCKDFNFILGVLIGNKTNIYIYTPKDYQIKYEKFDLGFNSLVKTYKTLKSLKADLLENYKDYEKVEFERQSLTNLLVKGIPFTADSFANYVAKNDIETCEQFYAAGINPNAYTSEGIPFLCVAVRNDCEEMVYWLLDKGADLNMVSKDRGYSPVMDAVWRKNYSLTKLFIEKGANLNLISSDGQPILVLAVGNGNAKIVDLLLSHGADADLCDSMGMSARAYALLFKKPEIIEVFKKFPKKAQ